MRPDSRTAARRRPRAPSQPQAFRPWSVRLLPRGNAQDERGADGLRHALQTDQGGKNQNDGLEQVDEWQPARLRRSFKDVPGTLDIRQRQSEQDSGKGQQKHDGAEKIDGSARPFRATGIENVDTYMPIVLQRPSRRQHEQTGVRIENRFLQPDRAEAERVAKDDHRKLSLINRSLINRRLNRISRKESSHSE